MAAYPTKESLPISNKIHIRERNQMTIQQRQELVMKNSTKLIKISQKRHEIHKKMENLVDFPVKMQKFKQSIRNIKTAQK